MAKSKSGGGARTQPVAIELLESDHRKVEALFEQYEDEKEGDDRAGDRHEGERGRAAAAAQAG